MKRILPQAFIGVTMAITFLAVSACKDIFHSKDSINYTELVLDMEHNDSVNKKNKDYYKFYAEQGKTYNILIDKYEDYSIYIDAFWYDTEETVIGELGFFRDGKTSFTATRSGNVVIRVTSQNINSSSYTIKITQ